eukprot:6185975-Pleurochrysis_carterae.AAC.1
MPATVSSHYASTRSSTTRFSAGRRPPVHARSLLLETAPRLLLRRYCSTRAHHSFQSFGPVSQSHESTRTANCNYSVSTRLAPAVSARDLKQERVSEGGGEWRISRKSAPCIGRSRSYVPTARLQLQMTVSRLAPRLFPAPRCLAFPSNCK